jgi:hypothetical protein
VIRHLDQPGQHRVGVHLEGTGDGADPQSFGSCAHGPHQLLGLHALTMQRRAVGLLAIATAAGAMPLSPGATAGMTIGAEIAEPHPALIRTVGMRAAMPRGIHLTRPSPRGYDAGWRATGRLGDVLVGLLTGGTGGLAGEARNGLGLTVALGPWAWGLRYRRTHGGGVAGPRPLEHEAQPHQGDQYQLVKKERGDHGKTPLYRWRNEGIFPGFSGYRMSRRIQVHDLCQSL